MRLSIDHRTRYAFTQPQARLVQMLRVKPSDDALQSVAGWRIDVDCDARLREGRDGFGNLVTMLYAAGPIDGIELAVTGEVLTQPSRDGRVLGTTETLPPAVYLRSTTATQPDAALTDFAHEGGDAQGALRLAERIAERFDVAHERPEAGLDAAGAFARSTATPRDLAHVMVALARLRGMPARYVSGHHLPGRNEGRPATAHGWVEVHEAGAWRGFDPSTGVVADDSYVRVAIGLDAHGAAPVAGSRLGFGEEVMDVAVQVERLGTLE